MHFEMAFVVLGQKLLMDKAVLLSIEAGFEYRCIHYTLRYLHKNPPSSRTHQTPSWFFQRLLRRHYQFEISFRLTYGNNHNEQQLEESFICFIDVSSSHLEGSNGVPCAAELVSMRRMASMEDLRLRSGSPGHFHAIRQPAQKYPKVIIKRNTQ